jgi:hypothetical protein
VKFVGILQAQCSPVVIGPYFLYPLLKWHFQGKGKAAVHCDAW